MDSVIPHPFFLSPADCAPEPVAPCGCEEQDCTPARFHGELYCMACGEDLPESFATEHPEIEVQNGEPAA